MTANCRPEPDAVTDDEAVANDDPGTGDAAVSDHGATAPSPDEAAARIRERGEAVRDRELATALARLEADDDLGPAEREAVEALADRLLDSLLAVPEQSLRAAAEGDDEETVRTALSLFR
jgi:glutamyl-tRNA reductase